MSEYNIFQAIFMSFYSKQLYRDVAQNWGGKSIFYLFVLLILVWIADTVVFQAGLNQIYSRYAESIVAQTPILTIKNGVISTPENKPYIITEPVKNKPIIIIDTSGQYTDINQTQAIMLVTPTQVITKTKPDEIRATKINQSLNSVIDPHEINLVIMKYIDYVWIAFLPLVVIFSFIYRIIQALLYSILGKIMSAIFGVPLTFGQVMSITIVALTPVIVLSTIFDYFSINYPHEYLSYFVLSIAYLLYGIVANMKAAPPREPTQL